MDLTRRQFIKGMGAGAALLVMGLNHEGVLAAGTEEQIFNPFVKIDEEGQVTVIIKHFEMGQGTTTGLTTLVTEELDADWHSIAVEFAPADAQRYKNLSWGAQGTGGSSSIANSFMQYREAGATARYLLVQAAAMQWNVKPDAITIKQGILSAGDKQRHFGHFVKQALSLQPPQKISVKTPSDFTLIGNPNIHRKDNTPKINGSAMFAMDVHLPEMLYVAVKRPAHFGATLKRFSTDDAKKVKGFIDAKALPNQLGIAVYATDTWSAFKARDLIAVEWDLTFAERRNHDTFVEDHKAGLKSPQYRIGNSTLEKTNKEIQKADKLIEASFTQPLLAHAPMEPLNCVIEPTKTGGVRIHDGCQSPSFVQGALSHVLQLPPEMIEINTLYAGGSFGRRATPTSDYQLEAALAYLLMGKTKPIKLIWSREDDIRGGYYRPMAVHQARIGLSNTGDILGWDHRIVTKSILKGTPMEGFGVKEGIDHLSIEGLDGSLYSLPNLSIGLSDFETPIPVLWWRSVGNTHTAFAIESLLDMVAHSSGLDPIALRLSLLDREQPQSKRMANVIETLRDKSGWKPGNKRGFAAHFSFNTYVAIVADITVTDKQVHVDKLHICVDCGIAVNPDVIRAQMEGGAGYALGSVLRDAITLEDGKVVESNFPNYPSLRMSDMPTIEVEIIASEAAPSGVGEPAVPPTGPAVANALFALTGKRVTELPMTKMGYTFV